MEGCLVKIEVERLENGWLLERPALSCGHTKRCYVPVGELGAHLKAFGEAWEDAVNRRVEALSYERS